LFGEYLTFSQVKLLYIMDKGIQLNKLNT